MVSLENESFKVEINPFGAELWSIVNKTTGYEYIWQGSDPWKRRAPILFPIVGRLINDAYTWKGKSYSMGQHGFARDMMFDIVEQSSLHAVFRLLPNNLTRFQYPFEFQFDVSFRLEENQVIQSFSVENFNQNSDSMPMSFGAHPAFNTLPIKSFDLQFENEESEVSETVVNGIRNEIKRSVFKGENITLTSELFNQDALIFSNLSSKSIAIVHNDGSELLSVEFPGFSHIGIWSKPGAAYVCIEPWMGIADHMNHSGDIEIKEGITLLKPGEMIARSMVIRL
jgi:galactose mutarotase-like enzyme